MFKKILSAVSIFLVATSLFAGVASANELDPGDEERTKSLTVGQVVSVGNDLFSIEKINGDQLSVQVSENTQFRSRSGDSELGIEDLSVGMWVAVPGRPDEEGGIIARFVILLPEDFNPDSLRGRRVMGEVTHINNGQDTFTLEIRSGDEITFHVNEHTRYINGLTELKDLNKGIKVGVLAVAQQGGDPLAKVVALVNADQELSRKRLAGKVESVSPELLSLTVRGGQTVDFILTAETQFNSLDGSVGTLQDLESGHVVVVIYEGDEASGLTALNVIASGEKLNQAINNLKRVGGEVQSAGGSHLTIQTHSGERLDFTVAENVRIQGVSGKADLNDLKNGMRVVVLYHPDESGNLVARVIFFGDGRCSPSTDGGKIQVPTDILNRTSTSSERQ